MVTSAKTWVFAEVTVVLVFLLVFYFKFSVVVSILNIFRGMRAAAGERACKPCMDNETVERPLRPQGLKDLPLDARPRRAHQESLAAWGLPGGVPRDRLPVPDDAACRD